MILIKPFFQFATCYTPFQKRWLLKALQFAWLKTAENRFILKQVMKNGIFSERGHQMLKVKFDLCPIGNRGPKWGYLSPSPLSDPPL